MKKVKLDLSWKVWSLIIGFFVLISVVGVSYAYGSSNPSVMGHSLSEVGIPTCSEGQSLAYDSEGNLICKNFVGGCHWEKSWVSYPTEGAKLANEKTSCDVGVCALKLDTYTPEGYSVTNGYSYIVNTCGGTTAGSNEYLLCCENMGSGISLSTDGQSNKIICTELYLNGLLDDKTYKMDLEYSANHFSKDAIKGYHAWAIPVVKVMRDSPEVSEKIISPLVNDLMEEIAYRSGKSNTGNEAGKIFLDEGVPLFERIGVLIDDPNWQSLFEGKLNLPLTGANTNKCNPIVENYFNTEKIEKIVSSVKEFKGNEVELAQNLISQLRETVEDLESVVANSGCLN